MSNSQPDNHTVPLNCACDVPRKPMSPAEIWAWARLILGAFLSGNAMLLALTINLSEADPMTRMMFQLGLLGVSVIVGGLVGGTWLMGLWRGISTGKFSVEGLFLLGMIGAFVYSLVQMSVGDGVVYFEVIGLLMVIYAFGIQIKRITQSKVLNAAEAWAPGNMYARRIKDNGSTEDVSVSEIVKDDRVSVGAGEVIPVDGVIESGQAWLRESEMTGEAYAVARKPGEHVLAATSNLDGTLVVRATTDGAGRRIDSLVRALEEARLRPSSIELQADQLGKWFLPIVALVSLITLLSWGLLSSWEEGLLYSMAALIVACPCALGFATPVGVWAAMGRMARVGMLFRGGDVVEELAAVDTVVFDKTGTLSDPNPRLIGLVLSEGVSWDEAGLLQVLRVAEQGSEHPIARAIRQSGVDAGVDARADHAVYECIDGEGMPAVGYRAKLKELRTNYQLEVSLLNADAEALYHEQAGAWQALIDKASSSGASAQVEHHLGVLVDGILVALARVDEDLLHGQSVVFDHLKHMGMDVHVMSGDRQERLNRLGLNINVEGAMTPEDKRERVIAMRDQGKKVLFVGDGVNDTAAMAESDVSIAVAEGAELAVENASMTWSGRDLQRVGQAIRVSRRALAVIKSNLVIAAVYNVVGLGIAASGLVTPVIAVIIMLVSSLVVSFRAATILDFEEDR